MAPGTHAFIGWWTANVVPLSRRDRLVVFLAGVLPDLDGLSLLYSLQAYLTYHHVLCHNLVGCILWTALVAFLSQQPRTCATLAFLSWHLHLACDYFGSGGPDGSVWPLAYLYPFIGAGSADAFGGPTWYWNRWQWPLNAWPNLLITLVTFIGFLYIAVRRDRTWFEFVWPRMDHVFCRTVRKWFGGQPVEQWSEIEAKFIRRSFLMVTIVALLACVVAGSASAYQSRGIGSSFVKPRLSRSFSNYGSKGEWEGGLFRGQPLDGSSTFRRVDPAIGTRCSKDPPTMPRAAPGTHCRGWSPYPCFCPRDNPAGADDARSPLAQVWANGKTRRCPVPAGLNLGQREIPRKMASRTRIRSCRFSLASPLHVFTRGFPSDRGRSGPSDAEEPRWPATPPYRHLPRRSGRRWGRPSPCGPSRDTPS